VWKVEFASAREDGVGMRYNGNGQVPVVLGTVASLLGATMTIRLYDEVSCFRDATKCKTGQVVPL
jgi:hypothetical protein